jgi:hypothetical protein
MPVLTLLRSTLLITSVRWLLIIILLHRMRWTSQNILVSSINNQNVQKYNNISCLVLFVMLITCLISLQNFRHG